MKHPAITWLGVQCLGLGLSLVAAPVWAKGPVGRFLDVTTGVEPLDTQIGYAESRLQKVQTDYQNQTYRAVDKRLNGALSLSDRWALSPDFQVRDIVTNGRIPRTGRKIPPQLLDVRVKSHYRNALGGSGTGLGLYLEAGEATDKLFQSLNNGVFELIPYLGVGIDPRTAFLVFINWANDRPYLNGIPLPGFSYGVTLSPKWGISLGFPHFGLWAEPFNWLKFNFSSELLYQFDGRLTFKGGRMVDVFMSAISKQEVYKRNGRSDRSEQLIWSDLTYSSGLSKKTGPLLLELSAGYGVNRYYQETANYYRDRRNQALHLANGWLGQFRAQLRF